MKGVIYSRVSTEEQDYERQTNELLEYAKRKKIKLVCEPLEEKESGFNDERSMFNRLLNFTKEEIDIILVWELTRLSRRSIKLQQTVQDFIDKGIRIFAYKDGFNTHNADGTINEMARMVLALTATMAESEAKTLKRRTMAGRAHSVIHKGSCYTNKAPYGYVIDNGKLLINSDEATIVKKIFTMASEGMSFRRIALYLKSVDSSRNWNCGLLAYIFSNSTYKGGRVWSNANIATPAIVDEQLWEKTRRSIAERTKHRSNGTEKQPVRYFLKGLIECSHCGRRYTHSNAIYKCISNVSNFYERCGNTGIVSAALDSAAWHVVNEIFKDEIDARQTEMLIVPYEKQLSKLKEYMSILSGRTNEIIKLSKQQMKFAMQIEEQNPRLYQETINNIIHLGEEEKNIHAEADRLLHSMDIIHKKMESIRHGERNMEFSDTEKSRYIHEVTDKIVIYGNRKIKVAQLHFYGKATCDLIYISKKWHYFKNDGYVEYRNIPTDGKPCENISVRAIKSFKGMRSKKELSIEDFVKIIKKKKLIHNCFQSVYFLKN